jgi:hypothetical protein
LVVEADGETLGILGFCIQERQNVAALSAMTASWLASDFSDRAASALVISAPLSIITPRKAQEEQADGSFGGS